MGARYHTPSQSPRYVCARNDLGLPGRPRCPTVSARVIGAVVERQVLAALAPAGIELSLVATDQVGREVDGRERHWQLQLDPGEAWMTDLADELTIPIPTLTA